MSRLCALILCAGLALSACTKSSDTASTDAASPNAVQTSDPCWVPGIWEFDGACVVGSIDPVGGTLVLPAFRSLGVVISFGANDAKAPTPFVLADAKAGDIGGYLNGTQVFPEYGKVPCVTPDRKPAACTGSALLYMLLVNGGTAPVTFQATPAIALSGLGSLDGVAACTLSTLVWSGTKPAWAVRTWPAKVNDTTITFPTIKVPQRYANRTFTVFAVTCTMPKNLTGP